MATLKLSRLLCDHKPDVELAASTGMRVLHEACRYNHLDIATILLQYGADPLAPTTDSQPPICFATTIEGRDLLRQWMQFSRRSGYDLMDWIEKEVCNE